MKYNKYDMGLLRTSCVCVCSVTRVLQMNIKSKILNLDELPNVTKSQKKARISKNL